MKKCPGCGQPIESFATRCPYCGMEIHSDGAASSLVKFTEKLDEFESKRIIIGNDNNSGGGLEGIGWKTIVLWLCLYPFLIVYYILKAVLAIYADPNFDEVDKRKRDFILNAPIPNNREDLMEFIILCSNRIENISFFKIFRKASAEINAWNTVWAKKMNMLGEKARISMKDDKDSLNELNRILTEGNTKIAENKKRPLIALGILCVIIIVIVLIFVFS